MSTQTTARPSLESLSPFARAYVTAALWTFDEDAPSGDYEQSGRIEELYPRIEDAAVERMVNEADAFANLYGHFWREGKSWVSGDRPALLTDDQAGHDFWLTRNHHGCGFWDRDLPENIGNALTLAAHDCGTCDLYVGDDGRIYL